MTKTQSHEDLQRALNNLNAAAKALEDKIKQADAAAGAGLKKALGAMTAAAKKLEFEIKQAEPTPDKIGRILVSKKIITAHDLNEAIKRKRREPAKYLGQILCEMGLPQSTIMKGIYYSNKRKRLGEILVERNIITQQQLDDVLDEQKQLKSGGKHEYLGALLIKNRIIKNEAHYMNALAAHFSMPVVSLKGFEMTQALQKILGEQFALKNRIVVMENNETSMTVAIAEPHLSVFDHLEKAMPKGKYIIYCLAKHSEIEQCFGEQYNI